MRVQKTPVLLVAAVAAAFSLTACNGDDDSVGAAASTEPSASSSAQPSQETSASDDPGSASPSPGSEAGNTSGSEAGDTQPSASAAGSGSGGACRTADLAFSSSHGMGEGEVLINLKNTGSGSCSMHGFAGVDLKGKDGTVSARRSDRAVPTVTLSPGEQTNFFLRFPPNLSGGSGATFTSAVVTPPNETHSHRVALSVNVAASTNSPRITVDPVGTGK